MNDVTRILQAIEHGATPAAEQLLPLDGNDAACGAVTFAGTSAPALTLVSGDVLTDSGPNQTVFNDNSTDTISAGTGPDLIFASSKDKVTGLSAADVEFIFGS
jgi:hypothetical protein